MAPTIKTFTILRSSKTHPGKAAKTGKTVRTKSSLSTAVGKHALSIYKKSGTKVKVLYARYKGTVTKYRISWKKVSGHLKVCSCVRTKTLSKKRKTTKRKTTKKKSSKRRKKRTKRCPDGTNISASHKTCQSQIVVLKNKIKSTRSSLRAAKKSLNKAIARRNKAASRLTNTKSGTKSRASAKRALTKVRKVVTSKRTKVSTLKKRLKKYVSDKKKLMSKKKPRKTRRRKKRV